MAILRVRVMEILLKWLYLDGCVMMTKN
jgi:hypothetical protein